MSSELLRKELIRDEGLKLEAYKDSLGFWTIGVGHLLGSEPRMSKITMSEALALLEADINEAEMIVGGLVDDAKLDAVRLRALTNMAFNLGSKLADFKHFLAAISVQDWPAAAEAMMSSRWATQVGTRATRLRDMILTGTTT